MLSSWNNLPRSDGSRYIYMYVYVYVYVFVYVYVYVWEKTVKQTDQWSYNTIF